MTSPRQVGSYRIERLLGVGSFATVWLGFDPELRAHVAIKVLAENWSHDLRVRERFLDEGRLLWRLDHDRLVRVHSIGDLADGRPYLVMAWAAGGSRELPENCLVRPVVGRVRRRANRALVGRSQVSRSLCFTRARSRIPRFRPT